MNVRIYLTDAPERPVIVTDEENRVLTDRTKVVAQCYAHDGFFRAEKTAQPFPNGSWVTILDKNAKHNDAILLPRIERLVMMSETEYNAVVSAHAQRGKSLRERIKGIFGASETLEQAVIKYVSYLS